MTSLTSTTWDDTNNPDNKRQLFYLSDHIIKTFSLPDFLEREIQCRLKWSKNGHSALCNCPMPDHKDGTASFRLNLMNKDGVDRWVWHCFGCSKSGSIITFCRDYFGLPNRLEAILYICKKFGIKNTGDLILEGIKNLSQKVDMSRKIENENILVSNQCRMLLTKDFNQNKIWVSSAYKKLNIAMDAENMDDIHKIGEEAMKRLRGNYGG